MIFVITGTNRRPFNRLIQAVDRIAEINQYNFLIQTGYSTYIPTYCNYFKFCDHEKFLSFIETSDLVISQSGFGTIGHCISLGKPIILVPREFKYGEAVDKQYELAEYMAGTNDAILCVRDVSNLQDAIERLQGKRPEYHYKTRIPRLIESFILNNFSV